MNAQELSDRSLLKELVDKVSILGDQRNFKEQVHLFTEDAVSETIAEGKVLLSLKGRREMIDAFGNFLKDAEVVYHFNGQQVININDDTATGTCYCLITLVSKENEQKVRTTINAIYDDEYVRHDGVWLISKRTGNFHWQERSFIALT